MDARLNLNSKLVSSHAQKLILGWARQFSSPFAVINDFEPCCCIIYKITWHNQVN